MNPIHVAVLRGGQSNERDISLETGREVIQALSSRYKVFDVVIDTDGSWYHQGVAVKPGDVLKRVDVVFNATHGAYGEDGKLQQILELFKVPFTGSGILPSSMAMHKHLAKDVFKKAGIQTPRHVVVEAGDPHEIALTLFRSFPMPVILKPVNGGSSAHIIIAKDFMSLELALSESFKITNIVLIEEYIKGKEITCGLIEDFRNQDLYTLLPMQIDHKSEYFEPMHKKEGDFTHHHVDVFSVQEKKAIENMVRNAHRSLGLEQYSRADMIMHPKRGLYLLEVNSQPNLNVHSTFVKSLDAIGSNLTEFIEHVLTKALENKKA